MYCVTLLLSHIILVPGGLTEKENVTVAGMYIPWKAEEERWYCQGSRESKFKCPHGTFKPVGISNWSEDFSQEETVLWRYWKESARTQLTSETFLTAPLSESSRDQEVHCYLKNEKTRKCKQRDSKQNSCSFQTRSFLCWTLGVWMALLLCLRREEQVNEAANGEPGFGWAAKPIKTAEPRQWQYFGMLLQWSKWPYISFYVFIFLYVYSHLNDLACFLVMPAKPDLFYLALPSNFLACRLLQGKMAGRGVFGLSWDVVTFFAAAIGHRRKNQCLFLHRR